MPLSSIAPTTIPDPTDDKPRSRKKTWFFAGGGLLFIVLALVAVKGSQFAAMMAAGKHFTPPPESVSSAKAELVEWDKTRETVGTLVAFRAVTIAAEVTGTVREISYQSGSHVKAGQLLVKLDTSLEDAQVRGAAADAQLSKTTLDRTKTLLDRGGVTQAELDQANDRAAQTASTLATLQVTIAKKTIKAPFDGRIAIRQVEQGQVVSPGTPLASLQSVSPIYADFWMPQQALADVASGQKVRVHADIFPKDIWEGEVSVVNPEIDVSTRNVRVRAKIDNPDGRLVPGMFVSVNVISGEKQNVIIVPATAVIYAPYGDSVFTLQSAKDAPDKSALVAQRKFVRLGERRGDLVAVVSGLSPGETVVSSGAFKLHNGSAVMVSNAGTPNGELAPQPTDK